MPFAAVQLFGQFAKGQARQFGFRNLADEMPQAPLGLHLVLLILHPLLQRDMHQRLDQFRERLREGQPAGQRWRLSLREYLRDAPGQGMICRQGQKRRALPGHFRLQTLPLRRRQKPRQ